MAKSIPVPERSGRIKADLILLLVAMIWGSAFVAQRVAATSVGVYFFNGLRFLVAVLVLLPLSRNSSWRSALQRWPWVLLLSLLLFGAGTLQQIGLQVTTAGNAGFITGLYVVFVPLFLALWARKVPDFAIGLAAVLAAAGMFLLSTGGSFSIARGDLFELGGAFLFTGHVILIGWLVREVDVLPMAIIQYLLFSLFSLAASLATENPTLNDAALAAWPILYTGVLSIGVGYTLQAVGQKVAPPADAAILLSLEAAFAPLFGWLLLGEQLGPLQLLGCALMFSGMLLAQLRANR